MSDWFVIQARRDDRIAEYGEGAWCDVSCSSHDPNRVVVDTLPALFETKVAAMDRVPVYAKLLGEDAELRIVLRSYVTTGEGGLRASNRVVARYKGKFLEEHKL